MNSAPSASSSPPVFDCLEAEVVEAGVILRMKSGPVLSSDIEGYRTLQVDVQNACRVFRQHRVVVDFSGIENMVADAFGIFDIPRRLGRTVVLCGLNGNLDEKLRLAGFNTFQVVGLLEEAMG